MTSSSTSGSSLSESPLDMLKKTAKADIIIQIWWRVNKENDGNSVSFILEAFDAYTSKSIASSTGTGAPSEEIIPVQLEQAVSTNIKPFFKQLETHFKDIEKNGREIFLTVKKWDSWDNDLETEIEGEEIIDHIQNWMDVNTFQGNYNLSDATENMMRFEQVRIPLYSERGVSIDARGFANELRKHLKKEPFLFEVKLMTRGLGEAILVLGEK